MTQKNDIRILKRCSVMYYFLPWDFVEAHHQSPSHFPSRPSLFTWPKIFLVFHPVALAPLPSVQLFTERNHFPIFLSLLCHRSVNTTFSNTLKLFFLVIKNTFASVYFLNPTYNTIQYSYLTRSSSTFNLTNFKVGK